MTDRWWKCYCGEVVTEPHRDCDGGVPWDRENDRRVSCRTCWDTGQVWAPEADGTAATVPKGTSGRASAGAGCVTCRKGRGSMDRPRLRDALKSCHDCAAEPGHPHADGCDTAHCLRTGHQRLACTRRHDHGQDIWTGEWSGVAECREFGWYSKFTASGWVRCGPDDPDGSEDLNRLHEFGGECHWDRKAGRWVLNDH